MTEFPKRLKLHFFKGCNGELFSLGECVGKNCPVCNKKISANHDFVGVCEYERAD